jgi:hypothetical protein
MLVGTTTFLVDEMHIRVHADLDGPPLDATGRDAIGAAGLVRVASGGARGLGHADTKSQYDAGRDGVCTHISLHSCLLPSRL